MLTQAFEDFLNREVDRKEFLLYCGILIVTVTGILNLIKSLETVLVSKRHTNPVTGFSSGPYGGRKGSV